MSEFTRSPSRRRRALPGTMRQSTHPSASTVIGLAHVAIGAIGVFNLLVALAFGGDTSMAGAVTTLVVRAASSAALVVGGLWLADGQRRGAILSCVTDAVRAGLLALTGSLLSADVLLWMVMSGAALWVLPQLELPGSGVNGHAQD